MVWWSCCIFLKLKIFIGICHWQRCEYFLFLGANWGCFVSLVMVLKKEQVISVASMKYFRFLLHLFFCLRSESFLSSSWTFSSKVSFDSLSLSVLINWCWRSFFSFLVSTFFIFPLLLFFLFFCFSSFCDLLLPLVLSFSIKARLSENDMLWKFILELLFLPFCFSLRGYLCT